LWVERAKKDISDAKYQITYLKDEIKNIDSDEKTLKAALK